MDRAIRIGYFLEDPAHESFIRALVSKVAAEAGMEAKLIEHDVRTATGGHGQVFTEFRSFLRDYSRGHATYFDLLVVAIDGNCQGHSQRKQRIQQLVGQYSYAGRVVCAVPDPHIEKWYLLDGEAFQRATGTPGPPEVPPHKCERNRYKNALRKPFLECNVRPPFGGAEYGHDIVRELDLALVTRTDRSLHAFVSDTLGMLRQLAQTSRGMPRAEP